MKSVLLFARCCLSCSNFYINKSLTFLFPQLDLPVNEYPQGWYGESQHHHPSDPWQVLQSECLECEEIVVHFHCEPRLFDGSGASVLLVIVLEWFGDLWVDDVVLGESFGVVFDVESGGKLPWSVCSTASVLAVVGRGFTGKTTLVSAKFVNVEFLSDQSVTKQ